MFQRRMLLATGNEPFLIGATDDSATTGTSLTISKHANAQNGDLLIALLCSGGTETWSTGSGWAEALDQGAVPGVGLQYRYHNGSSSYSFTRSSNTAAAVGQILCIRQGQFDVAGSIATQSGSGAFNAPGVTLAGGLCGCWLANSDDNSGFATGPSGFSLVMTTSRTKSPNGACGHSYLANAAAGATGALSVQKNVVAGTKAAFLFGVKAL